MKNKLARKKRYTRTVITTEHSNYTDFRGKVTVRRIKRWFGDLSRVLWVLGCLLAGWWFAVYIFK